MPMFKTTDGTEIYYNDWGTGPAIMFHHGWPLSADDWDAQMMFFLAKGYRVIAHDRRGHGRSTATTTGNEMDTYADDLLQLTAALDLKGAVHVGHSTGGGEVAHYVARAAAGRVAKAVLIGAVPPIMVKTDMNPGGTPLEVFDGFRAQLAANRAEFYWNVPIPFYGFNRPGVKIVEGGRLKKIAVPTLVMHGADDQIVPIADSALLSSKLVKGAELKVYKGFPHGMATTHADTINADLLAFIKS